MTFVSSGLLDEDPTITAEVEPEMFETPVLFELHLPFKGENLPGQMLTHRQYLLTEGNVNNNPTLSTLYSDFNFLSIYTFQLTCSWYPKELMGMK